MYYKTGDTTSLMEGEFPFQPKQPRYNSEIEVASQEMKDMLAKKLKQNYMQISKKWLKI